MNIHGESLKLKEVNLQFISSGNAYEEPSMNPLNGEPEHVPATRPTPVTTQHVPDLFSFDSNSPPPPPVINQNNTSQAANVSSSSSSSNVVSGDDRAAAVRQRYEEMRAEQVAKGVLEWDPVEERYREKVLEYTTFQTKHIKSVFTFFFL